MKKRLIIISLLCILLTGCGGTEVSYKEIDLPLQNSMIRINSKGSYSYLVDKNTGVVYMEYDGIYRHAITVMLNRDGTPVTVEQLGFTLNNKEE